MTPAEIRAYATRDWQALARSKAAYWVEVREELGAEGALAAADRLRAFTLDTHPGWPGDDECRADRESHERVSRVLSDAAKRWRS